MLIRQTPKIHLAAVLTAAAVFLANPAPAQQNQITLDAPAPPSLDPQQIASSIVGTTGPNTAYYWVLVTYPAGSVIPAQPERVTGIPASLSGSNFVRLTWPAVPGAGSYTVLKSFSDASPLIGNTCSACLLASGLTSPAATDTGGALGNYTATAIARPSRSSVTLNTRDFPAPRFVSDLDLCIKQTDGTCRLVGADLSNSRETELLDVGGATPACAAAVQYDAGTANTFKVSLDCNVTSSTLINEEPGQVLTWKLCQDGVGGRTHAFPAELTDASSPATAASACTVQTFRVNADGSVDPVGSARVLAASDGLEFECFAPATIPTPATGRSTIFCDSTNSDHWSRKNDAGVVVDLEAGGGGGGPSTLVYSCVVSTDATSPGQTSDTAATCVVPANTLSVGDFCESHSFWTYLDDGDATGTWSAGATYNGTNTVLDQLGTVSSHLSSITQAQFYGQFSVDSATVAETWGGTTRGTPVANWGGYTIDIDITAANTLYFRFASTGGGGDLGDTVTFKYGTLQCYTN